MSETQNLQGPPEKRVDPINEVNKRRDYAVLNKLAVVRVPDIPSDGADIAEWAAIAVRALRIEVYDYGVEPFQGNSFHEISDFIERFFLTIAENQRRSGVV